MIHSRTSRAVAAVLCGAVSIGACGISQAGNVASPDVRRQLFPVQSALATDNLKVAEAEAQKALALDPKVTETHLILGEIYWRIGEMGKAKAAFTRAKELGGGDAAANAGLALVALANDDVPAAEAAAQAAIGADKGNWLANFAQGCVFVAKNQLDAAFKAFEKGKGLKGRAEGRDLFDAGMGLVVLAEKDIPSAETSFIKARALAPNTVLHTMNLAAMYEAAEQWSQAANLLQTTEEQLGSSPMLSVRLGRALEKQRQWNDALREYQKALLADSTFAPALAALGNLYLLDKTKAGAAVEVLSRAVASQPTTASRLDLGTALIRVGRAGEAVPHLEAAAQQEPSSIEVKIALARGYVAADLIDKAMPLYEDVDVGLEAPAADLLAVAVALIKVKDYAQANTFLDKALDRDPELSDVHYRRGFIELMNKNYEASLQHFERKAAMDPSHVSTYMNMGIALQQMNKNAEAMKTFRKATQMAPNSVAAWVQLGQALSADSLAASQAVFKKALGLDPQSPAAKRGLAYTYLVQEQYPQAIGLLEAATQADPNDTQGWVWLGQALLNSGRHAEARNAYQRALKLDPSNKPAQDGLQLLGQASSSR